jgi:thiamine transport system substrate-binding protein
MKLRVGLILAAGWLAAACGDAPPSPTLSTQPVLTVMTHDSFEASQAVIDQFKQATGADVQFFKAGDAGTMLNKAILAKDNPLADVLYGVDNTFLSRALSEGIYAPYSSPALAGVPAEFQLDPENRALPVDYGDVCLNYDKAYFQGANLTPPANLEDLLKPEYKDLLVVENPATSSPGLAFLLATIGHFGPQGYLGYWQGLVDNGVQIDNDWDTAYETDFSLHGGQRPIVVSYGSSPPAEVYYADPQPDQAPTGVVTGGDSCFRQIEFVGVLAGAKQPELARKWVDFMLSTAFQEDMPLNMFVFPVNPDAKLPDVFTQFMTLPDHTAQLSPDEIASNRDAWIQAWTQTVLR